MGRMEKEFLLGFQRAAQLAEKMRSSPPSHTSAAEYMKDVAHLHGDADDPMRRGLAVGCLSAVGEE
jgi:hypothetical protein